MKGRKPKPATLKLLAGNPGKRAINRSEPKPTSSLGDSPEWFPAEAREEWDRIVPEMAGLGIITNVDRAIVEGHCLAYADMIQTAKAGKPLRSTTLAQLRFYAGELGLSPSSRARLKTPEKDDGDPTEEFFKAA